MRWWSSYSRPNEGDGGGGGPRVPPLDPQLDIVVYTIYIETWLTDKHQKHAAILSNGFGLSLFTSSVGEWFRELSTMASSWLGTVYVTYMRWLLGARPSATRSSLLAFIQDRGQNGVDLEVSLANLSFKQGVFGKEIFILLRMPSKMIYDVKLGPCDS